LRPRWSSSVSSASACVEQEAVVAVLLDLVENHLDHEVVRHELALVHVGLGLAAEVGLLGHVLTQQVARGDVGQVEVIAQACGLGAFAGPGRTEEDEVQFRGQGLTSTGGRRVGCPATGGRNHIHFRKPS
jgi:hypothetical protein